jgi:hypothetical protein
MDIRQQFEHRLGKLIDDMESANLVQSEQISILESAIESLKAREDDKKLYKPRSLLGVLIDLTSDLEEVDEILEEKINELAETSETRKSSTTIPLSSDDD